VLGLRRIRHSIVVAAVLGLLATPAAARAAGDCVPGAAWPAPLPAPATDVVRLVNAHRASIGLGPLLVSPTLTAAAVWKSRHMAEYGYVAPDDPAPPVARTRLDRVHTCAYPVQAIAGENIAAGARTPAEVMAGWLDSPGHRANIEAPEFAAIGVGVARAADGIEFWTQDFGSVADAGSALPPTSPAPPPPPPASPVAQMRVAVGHCRRAHRSRRAVSCRVRVSALAGPARLRARLVRRGHTVARGAVRVRVPGVLRVRLTGRRPLRAGRYRLAVRLGAVSARSPVRLKPRRR
jgi:uncharacterized protein YkwD